MKTNNESHLCSVLRIFVGFHLWYWVFVFIFTPNSLFSCCYNAFFLLCSVENIKIGIYYCALSASLLRYCSDASRRQMKRHTVSATCSQHTEWLRLCFPFTLLKYESTSSKSFEKCLALFFCYGKNNILSRATAHYAAHIANETLLAHIKGIINKNKHDINYTRKISKCHISLALIFIKPFRTVTF